MKLVVYLPALNEAQTIGAVLDGIPASIPGIDHIERIVIDDGSTDDTAAIAMAHGARVIRHHRNLGTGRTFVSGVSTALAAGADIIVSMDADGQFMGSGIDALVAPIRDGMADVVLCTRFRSSNLVGTMSPFKRLGNRALTRIISGITSAEFSDVSCGFRALSKEAALRVDIHSDFEYIHESLLNWSRYGLTIREVALPVLAERPIGESRIMRSVLRYALRSGPVLIRAIRDYNPLKFFGLLSLLVLVPSLLLGLFVTAHWLRTHETAPYTSLITLSVGGVLFGLLLAVVALLADLIGRLQQQVEELLFNARRSQLRMNRGRRPLLERADRPKPLRRPPAAARLSERPEDLTARV
jgi:glycosyltransferase involved in cell wall biosynthesis